MSLDKLRWLVSTIVWTALLLFLVIILFAKPLAPFRAKFQRPTIVYEAVPVLDEEERPFYQPVLSSSFKELKTFQDLFIVNPYRYERSLLLLDDTILFTGYIENEDINYGDWTSIQLFNVDMNTGEVRWHQKVRGVDLVTDGKLVFVETIPETFYPAQVAAFDIASGEMQWLTEFESPYAMGVKKIVLNGTSLTVRTFNKYAIYLLDPETGEIKEVNDKAWFDVAQVVSNGLVFTKEGYDNDVKVGSVVVTQENNGAVVWGYYQPVVSNIAIDGPLTFFINDKAELLVVDTWTGDILDTLGFHPRFPEGYDFWNNSIIVAAHEGTIAVYFEDAHQLILLRYEKAA